MKQPRQWAGGFPVEELIKALQHVLEVEPGAQTYRHPQGIGILDAAGAYAGIVGLPPSPEEPSEHTIPVTGLRFESGKGASVGSGTGVLKILGNWDDLPPSLQNRLRDGAAFVLWRGQTWNRDDFSQYLTDAEKTGDADG